MVQIPTEALVLFVCMTIGLIIGFIAFWVRCILIKKKRVLREQNKKGGAC